MPLPVVTPPPVCAQVRSEIQAMELEHEDEMEQLADGAEKKKDEVKEEEINFKTKLGKNIHRSGSEIEIYSPI